MSVFSIFAKPSAGFVFCATTFIIVTVFIFLCIKRPCDFYLAEPGSEYGKDLVELYRSGYAIPESFISVEKRYEKSE